MGRPKKNPEITSEIKIEPLKPEPKQYPILNPAKSEGPVTKPWGSYVVLDEGPGWKTKKIQVNPGLRFSLQSHQKREELWLIVEGEGDITLGNNKLRHVVPGDMAVIFLGAEHRMKCTSEIPLVMIEVQRGDYLGEDDIKRLHDDFGR